MPYLSWRGVVNEVLNQIVSQTGNTNGFAADPPYKRAFDRVIDGPERSHNGPSLCEFKGRMFVAWQGIDSDHHVNVAVLNRGSVAVFGLVASSRGRRRLPLNKRPTSRQAVEAARGSRASRRSPAKRRKSGVRNSYTRTLRVMPRHACRVETVFGMRKGTT
jgi:hypothetical protein